MKGDTKRNGIGLYICIWVLLLGYYSLKATGCKEGVEHRLAAGFIRHVSGMRGKRSQVRIDSH